jgi:hypothetical protein
MITCVTRSMNDQLYDMMLSLCPPDWRFIKVSNSTAFGYIDYLFTEKFDGKWVLNLDEDCFLVDYQKVYSLIEFLEKNDYDYCGVQDGGSIPVRIHNPIVSNPFFNLFNVEKISALDKDYYHTRYDVEEMRKKYSDHVRFWHTRYEFDDFEPFYSEFFWLLDKGLKPFFNNAIPYDKEKYFVFAPIGRVIPYYNSPTMILDHRDSPMALHTWHSRFYHYPNIKKRINNCFNFAQSNSNVSRDKKKIEIISLGK